MDSISSAFDQDGGKEPDLYSLLKQSPKDKIFFKTGQETEQKEMKNCDC